MEASLEQVNKNIENLREKAWNEVSTASSSAASEFNEKTQ